MDRHLFILNPAAGHRDSTNELRARIDDLGITDPYKVFVTDRRGAAEEATLRFLTRYSSDFVRIYACGGDGTLSEVANGIFRSGSKKCAVGIVPVGSGNDFAKSFEVTEEHFKDLKALAEGSILDVDMLVATDETGKSRVSLNIISAGFDAAVAKGQQSFKKLPFVSGSSAYNISLAKCLFFSMKNFFDVLVDGKPVSDGKKGPFLFTIAANGRYYGGGFKASPYSDLRDGFLDFVRIDTVPRLKLVSLIGLFREGRHIDEMKELVTYQKCQSLTIRSDKHIDLNLDGEIVPMKNPTIRILPRAVNILIPD